MPSMTHEDTIRARKLRAQGMIWKAIGQELGFDKETIRRKIDPSYDSDARRASINDASLRRRAGEPRVMHPRCRGRMSTERYNPTYDPRRDGAREHASIDAELMGDPPIGRSALDQRRLPPPAEN